MGYKLAGYEHLGGVEIDPKVAAVYKANHGPKHLYVEDIRAFNERNDLPDELFNLDLLDGSPPCSSFSMAGSREKGWGKEKVFREGQAHQRLDDLVFTYVETIAKLRPKVAILENVKGLLAGNAKAYAKEIVQRLRRHGYTVQVFLLNAATMGVPQMRERCFFIARLDASWPNLVIDFREPPIPFREFDQGTSVARKPISPSYMKYWKSAGRSGRSITSKGNTFGYLFKCQQDDPCATVLASTSTNYCHPTQPQRLTDDEMIQVGTYPLDYAFGENEPQYLIGMSVPPVMTAQIAHQINVQWLSRIKDQ